MAPKYTQSSRPLRITSPLGADVLIPVALTGTEALSRPFLFTVDFVSETASIDAVKILGQAVTLHLERTDKAGQVRDIHGIVRRFTALGNDQYLFRYRAEIVPTLWFLTLSSDNRTFEKQSPLDVAELVCKAAGLSDYKVRVTGKPEKLPYIVQYQESNFDFLSRLLERSGLYYTFEHAAGRHTLVFSDSHAGSIPQNTFARIEIDDRMAGGLPKHDTVFRCSREYAVHTQSVAVADHHFLRPDDTTSARSSSPGARGERFDFLGIAGPQVVTPESKLQIEGAEGERDIVSGSSSCVLLQAGTRISLHGGIVGSSNLDVHLLEVTHRMECGDVHAGGELEWKYENDFRAVPAATHFRPRRATPRPTVFGTHTAVVTGSGGGGAIDVDEHGRVLLVFPWDRGSSSTEHRVHVASVWGGAGWGFVQHPRIGQEVLVEYLGGDIERPVVTGRVFNRENSAPYALPGKKTQSGWKSRTLKGGADNFNEIRFDDEKGSEHVSVQAEKDLMTLVKNDETREVEHDRTTTIKNHDKRTVEDGDDEHTVAKGKQTNTIKGNQATTINDGNRTVTIEKGNDTLAVKMGNLGIKADMGKITIEAMQKIELKVGGNTITMDMSGITMKGIQVKIEGQAMTEVKAPMTQVKGDGILILKGGLTMIN